MLTLDKTEATLRDGLHLSLAVIFIAIDSRDFNCFNHTENL